MSSDTNIPTSVPSQLTAGTTWQWKYSLSDYPASSWTVTFYFLLSTGTTTFNAVAADDDDDHLVTVAAGTTAGYTPGNYKWQAYAVHADGRKCLVANGCSEVLQDFSISQADPRSPTRVIFDALEAAILGSATRNVLQTEINGKKIQRMSLSELRENYIYFGNLVGAECVQANDPDNPSALADQRTIRYTLGRG